MSQNKSTALTHTNKPQAKKGAPRRQVSAPSQMEEKLANLFNKTTQRARGGLADLETIGKEGVGHINVHRTSETRLGFLLSTAAHHDFTLFTKRFTHIDNLTMYFRSHCTNGALPTCSPTFAREFNKNQVKRFPQIQNLFVVVCMAYYEIFKTVPELLSAMKDNKLPLDSYYIAADKPGKRQRHKASATLVTAIQEAFNAVVEDREPDLKKFMFPSDRQRIGSVATREGRSILEVAHSMFSPRAIREKFQAENKELAAELATEEKERQPKLKAKREAAKPVPKAKPKAKVKAEKEEAAVELGDAKEIINKEEPGEVEQPTTEYKAGGLSLLALQAANAIAMGFEVERDEAGEPLKASKGESHWTKGEREFVGWMKDAMEVAGNESVVTTSTAE